MIRNHSEQGMDEGKHMVLVDLDLDNTESMSVNYKQSSGRAVTDENSWKEA